MNKSKLVAVLLTALCGPALAEGSAVVQHLSCTRLSGGPIHDLTLVIDDNAKELSVEPAWLSPDPDLGPTEFKGDTIEWSFMRGYAVLHRKTGIVDWDNSAEGDYLETIGQAPANDSDDNYRGKMQCKVLETDGAH